MSRFSITGRRYTRQERIERIASEAECYDGVADHLASLGCASGAAANRRHAQRIHRLWLRLTNPHNATPAPGSDPHATKPAGVGVAKEGT